MPWTAPRSWVAGEVVTASMLNVHLRDNLLAQRGMPDQRCDAYHSTTQTVTVASPAVLLLDSETTDTNGMHSTSANTSRVTIQTGFAGAYLVRAFTSRASGSGSVLLSIRKNGSTNLKTFDSRTESESVEIVHLVEGLVAGDYVEIYAEPISNTTDFGNTTAARATRLQVSGPVPPS